jgi:hypothetical protein
MFAASKSGSADAKDPQFNYVTMLLHGNGTNGAQNNTFLDSSTNNFTITRNGNTTQGTFTPYGNNWSAYFDGSGDYLTIGSSGGTAIGTSNFTVEFWIFLTNTSVTNIDYRPNSTNGSYITIGLAATSSIDYTVGGSSVITSSTAPALNTWTHIAVSRVSGSTRFFVNGVQVGSTWADSTTYVASNGRIWYNAFLGARPGTGYLSNYRLVLSGLYSTNFTPPTAPLTAISGTQALICQSNCFIDNSSNAYTITKTGDVSVQRFSPFSPTTAYSTSVIGGSGYFDGSGDYLTAPDSANTEFGSGDFTVEVWAYYLSTSGTPALIDKRASTAGYSPFIFYTSGGTVVFYASSNGSSYDIANGVSIGTIVPNQWNHIVASRSGTSIRLFLNGVLGNTVTSSAALVNNTDAWSFGATPGGNPFNGYLSDVRFLKGTSLYNSAFTPPTAPLTAITNTQLLLNYTNAGILDNAMMNDLETVGNAQISTSVKKYGTGSMYFDGTGDYLKNLTTPIASLQGDFTIECWLYYTAHGNYGGIVSCANSDDSAPPTSGWAFVFYSTTNKLYFETGTGFSLQTTNTIPSSQWNHVAVVRSGSTITHYLNGVANGSGTSSSPFNVSSTDNFVIGINRGLSTTLTGYIDDLRITKGYARYTANFTAPTAAFADKG